MTDEREININTDAGYVLSRDAMVELVAKVEARVRAELADEADRRAKTHVIEGCDWYARDALLEFAEDIRANRLTVAAGSSPDTTPLPESVCGRCRGENRPWSAPSPLWNAVMRGGSILNDGAEPYGGIICAACFIVLAEERIGAELWRLSAERVPVVLETVTPSGRVWDDESWLWVDTTPPLATGGVVQSSHVYLVGEKGPEPLPGRCGICGGHLTAGGCERHHDTTPETKS